MRLKNRLERIEQQAAPVVRLTRERSQARRIEIEKFRAYIQPDLDEMAALAIAGFLLTERKTSAP